MMHTSAEKLESLTTDVLMCINDGSVLGNGETPNLCSHQKERSSKPVSHAVILPPLELQSSLRTASYLTSMRKVYIPTSKPGAVSNHHLNKSPREKCFQNDKENVNKFVKKLYKTRCSSARVIHLPRIEHSMTA